MILNINPLVCYFDDFLNAEQCQHLINLASPHLTPSTVCSPESSEEKILLKDERRTSDFAFIPHNADNAVAEICYKLSKYANLPLETAEQLQVIHYGVGKEYQPHWDSWDLDQHNWLGKSGQRIFTALVYLNDVDEGGGTIFPNIGIEVKPKMGRCVFFQNTLLGRRDKHPMALHGGSPVLRGEKFACNLWFREKPYV